MKFNTLIVAGVMGLSISASAASAAKLTFYCSAQEDWCQLMARSFEDATGINVNMTRKSSGETFAQIRAEASNPKGDVWWGGTGDPHLQAAEEGLTAEYMSPMRDQLHPWAISQAESAGNKTIGIYSGALGYGYNTEVLAANNLPEPGCWKDLLKPEYKGHVQMANPNSSGTAYTTLASMVQIFGEDEGFEFMKGLHSNINQYTKSGSAPIKAAGRGENTIGIVFMHDAVKQAVSGFPVKVVAPCEGTGYEIGSMSIVDGARNMDEAKAFYDWALTAEAQNLALEVNAFQVPSNTGAKTSPSAPDMSSIKLIDYNFKKYGSSNERKRLLKKWDDDVSVLPQYIMHNCTAKQQIHPTLILWIAIGWIGFFILPWYGVEDGFFSFLWLFDGYPFDADYAPAAILILQAEKLWLAPMLLFLACPLLILKSHKNDLWYSRLLILSGAGGLAYLTAQGFGIGIRGFNYPILSQIFGELGDRQYGMGYGGLMVASAFLFLLTQGIAARGAVNGDIFVVSAIGGVIAIVATFVFFPIATMLITAFVADDKSYSIVIFFSKLFDDRIWGLGCFYGTRCGVAWNSLFLAILVKSFNRSANRYAALCYWFSLNLTIRPVWLCNGLFCRSFRGGPNAVALWLAGHFNRANSGLHSDRLSRSDWGCRRCFTLDGGSCPNAARLKMAGFQNCFAAADAAGARQCVFTGLYRKHG